jgi:predicted DCC family thiol-disulfide oxidoreductase YuxK
MTPASAYSYRSDPSVPQFPDDRPVIVLDGHCVLCARSAQFVLDNDPKGLIRMTAAQSPLGEALYRHYGLKSGDYDTVLLIEDGRLRVRADAGLRILEILGVYKGAARLARWVPRPMADAVYALIAKNRIRIWGGRETCYAPPQDRRDRFI